MGHPEVLALLPPEAFSLPLLPYLCFLGSDVTGFLILLYLLGFNWEGTFVQAASGLDSTLRGPEEVPSSSVQKFNSRATGFACPPLLAPLMPGFGRFRGRGLLNWILLSCWCPVSRAVFHDQLLSMFSLRPMVAFLGFLWKAAQAPETARGFCYPHHLMSYIISCPAPTAVSVSQGQELWCQLPPSYLSGLCLNLVTDAFLKVAQLLQQLPVLAQEPRAR